MLLRLLRLSLRKPLVFLLWTLAGSSIAALVFAASVRVSAERSEPGRGAAWIWADGVLDAGEPVAFWAVRDFEIHRAEDLRDLWVGIAVDEAYELWLNGRRIGSGRYAQGGPADRFFVGDRAQVGWNRLLVEARSSRGAGGLQATVRAGERILLRTDDSWRIFRRADPRILRGSVGLDEGAEEPVIWGRSATGRFRLSGLEDREPADPPGLDGPGPEPATPARWRPVSDDDGWRTVDSIRGRRLPASQMVYDFGSEQTGFLEVEAAEDGAAGLIFYGVDEPDPYSRSPDTVFAPFPGRRYWRDVEVRRFRYVALIGLPALLRIEVVPSSTPPVGERKLSGVFGLPSAQEYLPVEEAVWDRLRTHPETSDRETSDRETSDRETKK